MMTYFKSAGDYNNFRYFSCVNFNKKSKKNPLKKLCEGKMKIDLLKELAEITNLHTNECLEKTFGQITIMPSLHEEITKREQILDFANKLLVLKPAIPLTTFKEQYIE